MSLKMKIHKLEPDIIAKIRSSITINSITQCITELVLNSLDARSTAIAVRLNFVTFRIQVVDNGDGIIKDNFDLIGQRYMTSKRNNLESQCAYYGYRGEALASVINISKVIKISSKPKNTSDTWSTSFVEGIKSNVISVNDRPSYGTTVTIEGFLYNLPLRKKGVIPEVELDHIKRSIECLIIMYPNISFSLRNDVTGDLILNNRKCENIISSFKFLHPEVKDEYSLIKVSKNNVTIKGLLFKGMFENKNLQYIYINKRPIKCPKIQIYINNVFHGNKEYTKEVFRLNQVNEKNKYYVYVINIKCPYSSVDILSNATKTTVEFKNWDLVLSCVEKLILSFLGCNEKTIRHNAIAPYKAPKSDCGISQINGVFKSYGFKRKRSSKNTKSPLTKKQKVINTRNVDVDGAKELPQHFINNCVSNNDACVKRIKKVVSTQGPHKQLQNKGHNSNINFLKNSNNISEFSCQYKAGNNNTINNDKSKNISNVLSGQNNDIQTFKKPIRKIASPLPIKVFNKGFYKKFNSKMNVSHCIESTSYKINETNNNAIGNTHISREFNIHMQPYEKSFSMQYTNDENKGKNLIMDMFLKSTQIYNSDDESQSDKKNDDTVFEVKSNYFLENNITANINGKNKTMSVSVNITKTIRKKFNRNKKIHTVSKAVQTSLEKNYMIAKSLQTSLYREHNADNDNYIFSTNDTKLAENCTIILSRTNRKTPMFRFIHQKPSIKPIIPIQENKYKCSCHRNFDKLVTFDTYNEGTKTTHNNVIANNFFDFKFYDNPIETFCGCYGKQNNFGFTEDIKKTVGDYFRKKSDKLLEDKQFKLNKIYEKSLNEHIFHKLNPCLLDTKYQKEPMKCNLNNGIKNKIKFGILPRTDCKYKLFNPQYQSTQVNNIFGSKFCEKKNYWDGTGHITPQKNLQQYDLSYSTFSKIINRTDKNLQSLHNSVGDYYEGLNYIDINPENKVTFSNLKKKCESGKENNTISHHNPPNSHQKIANVQKTKISSDFEEELFITLSNQQKQEILEKELSMEKQLHNKINLEWESQMAISKEKEDEKQNNAQEYDEEWIKKQNNFGSNFYINKRTGFTTFYTPKPTANDFKLCKRLEFVPKGLSPILKDVKEVDKSLSQNKKDKLETYILESYQSDLLAIKWQRYLKNKDIKTFFDEMYKEKLNSMESCIPTAVHSKKHSKLSYPISFDKTFLSKITVIGQVDKKFIAALEETKHLLVLFDQHAVHERIRLEELLEGYSNAKVPTYREKFMVFLSRNDLSLLKKHEQYLNFLGLYVEYFEDGISVVEIPLCLHNKFKDSDVPNSLNTVIQLLVKEIIDLIKETRGVTFKNLPKIIQNVINLEACRGAIKFGDKLSNSECEQLLKKLSICNLPFQCAHGRPTLVPLLTLNLTNPTVSKTVNFKNIYFGS